MDVLLFIYHWIGPVLVVTSLALPNPFWFRVTNLTGSVLSAISSWTQDVIPFVFMNGAIALINIYWLWRMSKDKHHEPIAVLTNVGRDSSAVRAWGTDDVAAVERALAQDPNAVAYLLLTDKAATAVAVLGRNNAVIWTNADDAAKGRIASLAAA